MSNTTLLLLLAAGGFGVLGAGGLLSRRFPVVIVAYGLGLVIGLADVVPPADRELVRHAIEACVAIAIPALLLEASWGALSRLGRQGVFAVLSVFGGAFAAAAVLQFAVGIPAVDVAMTLAIFTGSLANLQLAGLALGVPEAHLIAANLGDVVAGGISFLLFSAFGYSVATAMLAESRLTSTVDEGEGVLPKGAGVNHPATNPPRGGRAQASETAEAGKRYGLALGLAVSALLCGVGANALWRLSLRQVQGGLPNSDALPGELVILGVATAVALSLGGTRWVRRRNLPAAGGRVGEALLLTFCVLVGTLADWSAVGLPALAWAATMAAFLCVEVSVALLLARVLGVEAGTWLLALIGAIYSPAFVGPVAQAVDRRDSIAVGVVTGLIGLALGTPAALMWVRWFA